MDEIKTTGDTQFNFSLVLPKAYFDPGKYLTLTKE
jgi:hypothetical protein